MLKVQRAFRRSKKRQCRHESATLSLRCIAVRKLHNYINYPLESLNFGAWDLFTLQKSGFVSSIQPYLFTNFRVCARPFLS